MSDDTEKLLREKARKLVTDILRDPFLALEYRDIVLDSFEDSNSERTVTKWMTKAGYATRHDLFRDEIENGPRTNLASWDGIYVIRVDGGPLLSLQIDASGVKLNRRLVSEAVFADGILRFGPVDGAWSGELSFTAVTPMVGRPLSDGGTFQRSCTGKLWKQGAAKPDVANAHGATKRLDLPPSPPADAENAVVRTRPAAGLLGAEQSATFVGKWTGDYAVSLISTDPTTHADIQQTGPDYGVTGDNDTQVTLTYVDPFKLNLTLPANQPSTDHIVYTAGQRKFDLTFGQFAGDVRGFSGKIYPASAPVPSATNVSGVARSPLAPQPSPDDHAIVDVGLAIAIGTLVAALGACVATVLGVKYADYLAGKREYEKAVYAKDRLAIKKAETKLNNLRITLESLPAGTQTNVTDAGLFGDNVARELWAKQEATRIDTEATRLTVRWTGVDATIKQLDIDIPAARARLLASEGRLADLRAAHPHDAQAIRDEQGVLEQEKRDVERLESDLAAREADRADIKSERERLVSDLQKIHKLPFR
jgi:hypothetical protein